MAAAKMRQKMDGNMDQIPKEIMDKTGGEFVFIPKGQTEKMDNVIRNLEKLENLPKVQGSPFIIHKQDIRGDLSSVPQLELDDIHDMVNDTGEAVIKQEMLDDDLLVSNTSDRWGVGDGGADDVSDIGSVDSADATYIDVVGGDIKEEFEIKIEPGQSLLKTSAFKTVRHQDDDL